MKDLHFQIHIRRLLQEFSFIRELNPIVQSQLADIVVHQSRKKEDVLFKQHDPPEDCYMILQGEVAVWQEISGSMKAPTAPAFIEGSSSVRRHAEGIIALLRAGEGDSAGEDIFKSGLKMTRQVSTRQSRRHKSERQDNTSASHQEAKEWAHVATMGPGTMIGEAGLLLDQPRNATLRCKTECEFLVIKRPDFERVLKKAMNQLRARKLAGPMRQFLKEFEFYRKLSPGVQVQVPEIMNYTRYRKKTVVFRKGDNAEKVFVILTGEVGVWKELDEDSQPVEIAHYGVSGTVLKMKCAAMLTRLREEETYKRQGGWIEPDGDEDPKTYGCQVASMGPGAIFGELALLESKPRTATVICSQDCEFLCIDKADFDQLLKEKMREANMSLPIIVEPLLKQIPFFQSLRAPVLDNVSHVMTTEVLQAGRVLFWEGDPPGSCYFILEGGVSVWKKDVEDPQAMLAHKPPFKEGAEGLRTACSQVVNKIYEMHKRTTFEDVVREAISAKEYLKAGDAKAARDDEAATEGRQHSKGTAALYSDVMGLQVASLGQGVVFGETALMEDQPRNATIVVEKMTRVLSLTRDEFERVVKQDILRAKVRNLASSVRRVLKEFSIFKDFSQAVQDQCAEVVHYTKERRGQLLFEEGDPPGLCYILLSGEVTVWKSIEDDKEAYRRKIAGQKLAVSASPSSPVGSPIPSRTSTAVPPSSAPSPTVPSPVPAQSPIPSRTSTAGNDVRRGSREASRSPSVDQKQSFKLPISRTGSKDSAHQIETKPEILSPKVIEEECISPKSQRQVKLMERPAIAPSNPAAQEKCATLASMLSSTVGSGNGTNTLKGNSHNHYVDDSIVQSTSNPVAALGLGSMFGEMALVNDQPRNASISCWTDCEFLVIEKEDFDRILKTEMRKSRDAKLEFLRSFVPGVRKLPTEMCDRLMYYFVKESLPRNHVFIEQDAVQDGSIYFIWQGSVEQYRRDAHSGGFMRQGILMRGSLFASLPQGARASCSSVACSAPCEVLRVKPECKRHLPESVIHALREVLELTMQRRAAESFPLSPMGSASRVSRPLSTAGGFSLKSHGEWREKQLPGPRYEKVPRPLTGFMPPAGTRSLLRPKTTGMAGGYPANPLAKACSLPSFVGLFQKVIEEVDYEAFDLDPGETIAMTAKKPRKREKRVKQDGSRCSPSNTSQTSLSASLSSLPSLC